ncbi:ZrgA family zinc uptake protein [Agarivorans sp. MS3-6]
MKLQPIFVAGLSLLSCAVYAQSAHQHGVAELFFAASGEQLDIDIHSPADNLLGFEHVPVNEQQQQLLSDAQLQVAQAMQLFTFDGGECELEKVTQDWGALEAEHHEHGKHDHHDEEEEHHEHDKHDHHDVEEEHHEHDKHGHHDEEEEHHEHDKHDHHSEAEEHDAHDHAKHQDDEAMHEQHNELAEPDSHDHSSHQDVRLSYQFHCHQLSTLNGFELQWFEAFPRIQVFHVQGVSDSGQTALDAKPNQNKVKL